MNIYFLKVISKIAYLIGNVEANKYDISSEVESIMNVSYSGKNCIDNKLDIHFPKRASGLLPIVVYIHGGGWALGDKGANTGFCKKLADNGFLVFNINYGLGPKYKHPAHLLHVISAINWIKENCKRYNGDVEKFFLAGDSAGAHLASLIACICTNKKIEESYDINAPLGMKQIKGLILYYGVYNFDAVKETGFPFSEEAVLGLTGTRDLKQYQLSEQISPMHHVTENFPPVFITSGEVDWLHKTQTLEMIKVLENNGIRIEKLLFDSTIPEGQHGFQQKPRSKCASEASTAAINFLRNYLK